jgi:hypothetical protein
MAMNHDEQDALWDLLGKARAPKERPFFASKVMRAIRAESESAPAGFWAWLRAKWAVPVTVAACVAVVTLVALQQPAVKPANPVADALNSEPSIEEVIEDSIDQLLAAEDHSVWLSADPSSFLP